jgi:hypothetical protein
VCIAGIIDTGDKIFTGVTHTGDQAFSRIFINSMTLAIDLSPVTTTVSSVSLT